MRYGELVDIGRRVVEEKVARPLGERLRRWLLREGLTSRLFAPAFTLGLRLRPMLPPGLQDKLTTPHADGPRPTRRHGRKVLMLAGCVQPAMAPNINGATMRVLDAIGVESIVADGAGCCGAIRQHLGDHASAMDDMRRNVDAWWPMVARGEVEAIVINASGCGVQIKDYARELAGDPAYADRAARIAALARDPIEFLEGEADALRALLRRRPAETLAWHPPCTLQHGQRLGGRVEVLLGRLGFNVALPAESHLCCGSAGTYSVLQPVLSKQLRQRKLKAIAQLAPERILSANIGCIQQLQAGTTMPVQHWLEFLDETLQPA